MTMRWGCQCPGSLAVRFRRWRVTARHCNHSAFNGYRRTPSAYSGIVCLDCRNRWRTRAAYVDDLRDATEHEIRNA